MVFVWILPKADPGTRLLERVVYLGDDSRKQAKGTGKSKAGKRGKPRGNVNKLVATGAY